MCTSRENGNNTKIVIPRRMWALKIGWTHHFRAVEMLRRHEDRRQAQDQLRVEQQQNGDIHVSARGADTWIDQPPVDEQGQADEAEHAEHAAHEHGHELLGLHAEAHGGVDIVRRQQPHEVPGEDREYPDVEAIAADEQQLAAEQLAGAGAPAVLLAIEANDAANHEDAERDVRIETEKDLIEIGAHLRHLPQRAAAEVASGAPAAVKRTASSSHCRSSASRASPSGVSIASASSIAARSAGFAARASTALITAA